MIVAFIFKCENVNNKKTLYLAIGMFFRNIWFWKDTFG